MKQLIIIGLSFLFVTNTFAQDTETGNWWIYFGNKKIDQKWNWHHEVQYRNYNAIGDLQQLLIRTGIGYNLTENNNNLLLGYGFIHSENYVGGTDTKIGNDEHRIYQQFTTRQNFGRIYTQHRYRLEERFLPTRFALRFRYLLGMNVPISKKTMLPRTLYASAYNEVFLNTKSSIFDRNRLYGALGYTFSKNLRGELGFMAQTLERSNRNQFQIVVFNNF
jgi:hypothetical protein